MKQFFATVKQFFVKIFSRIKPVHLIILAAALLILGAVLGLRLFLKPGLTFPANTTIVSAKGAYAFKNTTNEFQTEFKSKFTDPDSIVFKNDLGKISFYTPSGQSFGDINSDNPPVADGSTLTYPAIFPQIDLRYTISSSRLLEEFIIKDAETAAQISRIEQRAQTKNTYVENDDGSITFYNKENQEAFTLPHPVMYEIGNLENKSAGIIYEIKADQSEIVISKVITEEGQKWLADPKRVYPIAIDLVIDNADTSSSWVSSDPANTTVSQETTIKQEGSGSVKVQTTAVGAPVDVDLMEYSSNGAAQASFVTNSATANATGGTITTSGGYTIHTFTSNGTFTPPTDMNVEVLVVAGGGGGGSSIGSHGGGGGGGAGGFIYNTAFAITQQAYAVTVGNGGSGGAQDAGQRGQNGGNSVFSTITATGGGGGGDGVPTLCTGLSGGSGGGAGYNYYAACGGGGGTGGQGNSGGGNGATSGAGGGGGGGAGGAGSAPSNSPLHNGGTGGVGLSNSITGSAVFYAGGGGGGQNSVGGNGGGGNGGVSGTVNTGGGGGGWYAQGGPGGNGGSGIVIIRYLTPPPTPQAYSGYELSTGGTITTSGGYTIHTFTSNGTFTPPTDMNVEVLVVAGGGGGGMDMGGGGGGGGVIYNSNFAVSAPANVNTIASCKAILDAGASIGNGVYTIDPDGTGGNAPFQAYCNMTYDGGGWTMAVKSWYGSGMIGNTGAVGTVADATTRKGNPYKLSDVNIRNIIGASNNFDVMADQNGYNSAYSTGNYEYVVLRNYTGSWTYASGGMPASISTTVFQSYRISDNSLAWTGNIPCYSGTGLSGINCAGSTYQNPQGGAGCYINMGTASNAGWYHFYMNNSNDDTYLYICNGPQHSSSYDLNHRWWIRERGNVIVGIGGRGAPAGSIVGQPGAHQFTIGASNGQDSKFYTLTAIGGGRGGSSYYQYTPGATGASGGSGGGSSGYSDGSTRAGGTGTAGQGYAGGQGGGQYYSGGGGGAGGAGTNSTAQPNGGVGYLSAINGTSLYWGGGGGGAGYSAPAGNGGLGGGGGGSGGGGSNATGGGQALNIGVSGQASCAGCWAQVPGGNGGANTGGGGGGGSHYNSNNKGGDGGSGIVIVKYLPSQAKTQGSYSLKGVANITTSLNKTLTRTIETPLNLSDKPSVTFDIRTSRTGSNIKVGLHDSGGTTTEVTPNITQANTFQSVTIDLSGVSNANKDAIDQIIITIVNADATNTFYLDNMVATAPSSLNDTVTRTTAATDLSAVASITYWVRSSVAGSYATFGFGESTATEQTNTITINQANTWEQKSWNIESISAASRNAVTKFAFTFTGDTSGASFYFDDIQTNALFAPTLGVATGLTNTSIRWNFTDNSGEETGFKIYDSTGATVLVTCAGANLTYCDETGLSLNTQYTRKIGAYNTSSVSISSGTVSGYTLAAVPAAPVVSSRAATTVSVNPDLGTNPAAILMAIYREEGSTCDGAGGVYLAANGSSNGSTAVWQTDATWGTLTATGLTSEKAYAFCAKAKNGDGVETAFSAVGSHNAGFIPLSGDYVCTQDTVNSSSFTNRYLDGNRPGENPSRYVIALDGGSFLTTLDLELMEYSSNGTAQSAYVTNGTFPFSATGGAITYSGNYTIHTFTGSSTFTPNNNSISNNVNVETLIVAGGSTGAGGGATAGDAGVAGGGGGGGDVYYNSAMSVTSGGKTVTVGAADQNSSFNGITAPTGAGGTSGGGVSGGAGGGKAGGGGGGENSVGSAGYYNGSCGTCSTGGNGGAGYTSSISGTSIVYGSGGGGGGGTQNGPDAGSDGGGVGGDGGGTGGGCVDGNNSGPNAGYPGTTNRGGGGGGGGACYGVGGPGGAGGSGIVIVRYLPSTNFSLQSYFEPTIKTQGTYALKGIAAQTTSLNKTLTRTLASPIDLSGRQSVTFDIRTSRGGSFIKVGLRDAGGTITEVTPTITQANTFQTATISLSGVTNANKDSINQIIITIVNADADNTFYIDNMLAIEETTTAVNDAVFEAKSCIMTLNSTDTLVLGSLSLTGGSIAIADGGVIKIKQPVWIVDADGDGYSADGKLYYGAQPAGGRRKNLATTLVAGSSDCNDASYSTANSCCTVATRYQDADGDGYGNPGVFISACPTAGYVTNGSDCYDANASAYPGSGVCSASHRGDGSYDWNCSGGNTGCGTTYYGIADYGTRYDRDENTCGWTKSGEDIKCCAVGGITFITSGVGCGGGGYSAGWYGVQWTCADCGSCPIWGTSPASYGTQACQ